MKRFKDILIGVLIGCMVFATPVLAESILTKIDVALNGVNVQVEGVDVDVNSILYNGTTYLPMRKVAELVGKDIEWYSDTMTANIVEVKKEGDTLTTESIITNDVITHTENGIILNGKEYYENRYIQNSIKELGNYSIYIGNQNTESIQLTLAEFFGTTGAESETLIESIPYEVFEDRLYISKDYYENTILPLINK